MIIVKIGGGESINKEGIVRDLAQLDDKFIIVLGANAVRDKLAEDFGKPKKTVTSVSGYSSVFSDSDAIDVMLMAYSGLTNKRFVELCQKNGINAVGLSGLDGKIVQGKRNSGIRVKEGEKLKLLRDFSGKPKKINKELLMLLLDNGYTPVLSMPIIDENNFAINSENDDVVRVLQENLNADMILQLIEAPGFLDKKDDENSILHSISREELKQKEEQVDGRMKRKMLALRKLFENGASKVIISDGRVENPINDALNGRGTVIE